MLCLRQSPHSLRGCLLLEILLPTLDTTLHRATLLWIDTCKHTAAAFCCQHLLQRFTGLPLLQTHETIVTKVMCRCLHRSSISPPLLSNMGISQNTGASRIDREKVLFLSFADFNQQKTDLILCDSVAEKRFNKCSNRRDRNKRMHYCIAQVSSGSSRPHAVHTEIAHLTMVQAKMYQRSYT